jgi:Spy/CpxP family protein refolding chaperone
MKSIRNLLTTALLTAAAAWTATAGISVASAADDAVMTQPPAPPGPHGWHHGGRWHLLGKLGLSAAQKQQIKDIMTAAHPQMQSLREQVRAQVFKVLTPEQQTQLTTLEAQSRAH